MYTEKYPLKGIMRFGTFKSIDFTKNKSAKGADVYLTLAEVTG